MTRVEQPGATVDTDLPRVPRDQAEVEAVLMWGASVEGDVCLARHANGFSICTRMKHHDRVDGPEGDHVAAGTRHVTARWSK